MKTSCPVRGPEIIIGAYKWATREPGFGDVLRALREGTHLRFAGPPISLEVTAGRVLTPLAFPSWRQEVEEELVVAKDDIRRELLRKRVNLPSSERVRYDRSIVERLSALPEFAEAGTLLLYCAVRGEPDISPLFEKVLARGQRLVLPRIKGEDLELVSIDTPACLSDGTFNIPEPSKGVIIEPEEVELAVIPGVAFDREGFRIGFGKGYYDRLLERVRALKVGVAYSFQVLDKVPRDYWDKPVDIIVTEKEVIRR